MHKDKAMDDKSNDGFLFYRLSNRLLLFTTTYICMYLLTWKLPSSLWFLMILMDSYGFLWILIDSYRCFMIFYGFLWILWDSFKFFGILWDSLDIFINALGFFGILCTHWVKLLQSLCKVPRIQIRRASKKH